MIPQEAIPDEEIYLGYLLNARRAVEEGDLGHALCHCAMAWWAKNDRTLEALLGIEENFCGRTTSEEEIQNSVSA